ncbi:MAG: hypothetical protein ABSE35_12700 [Bryobacteraceae bacterium]|jgi:hypothetical protein
MIGRTLGEGSAGTPWENLWAAYCVHFAYYSFCRIHKTLRVTPAMEAKITNRVWDLAELLA